MKCINRIFDFKIIDRKLKIKHMTELVETATIFYIQYHTAQMRSKIYTTDDIMKNALVSKKFPRFNNFLL